MTGGPQGRRAGGAWPPAEGPPRKEWSAGGTPGVPGGTRGQLGGVGRVSGRPEEGPPAGSYSGARARACSRTCLWSLPRIALIPWRRWGDTTASRPMPA